MIGETELTGANATLCEFVDLLRHLPKNEAKEKITGLSQAAVKILIEKPVETGQFPGPLMSGLRALKNKGLLESLEIKIGAANIIRLLDKQGTFMEFIQILQYSSQALLRDLLQNCSADLTGRLIENAIEKKYFVNSLLRQLKLLERLCGGFNREFEDKIGMDNIIKLVFCTGNPGTLCQLIGNFPDAELFRLKLIEIFNALTGSKKAEFILRGDFFKCCTALTDCKLLEIFSKQNRELPPEETALIEALLKKSTFKSINRGLGALDFLQDKLQKVSLLKPVNEYINTINQQTILFESVSERISFLSILSRLENLEQSSLITTAAQINEEEFFREKDFIGSLQLLQHILVVHGGTPWLKEEILRWSNSDKIISKLEKERILNIFLYLWNTYALFLQEDMSDFDSWLNPGIVNMIYRLIEKQKKVRANIEATRHLLMLIGLLDFLGIDRERIGRIFPRGFKPLDISRIFLERVLAGTTFIPGFFYLKGIDFFAKSPLFPNKWKILIPRLFDLNIKTKGITKLIEAYQKKIKRLIFPT